MSNVTDHTAEKMYHEKRANIAAIIERMEKEMERKHCDGEKVHWGHVGSLNAIEEQLQQASDRLFGEGEYSA